MSDIARGISGRGRSTQFYPPRYLVNFRGGLNEGLMDELIEDNQLSMVENLIPDRQNSGMLKKRVGITNQFTIAETGLAFFDGQLNDYILTDDKIYTLDGTSRLTGLTSATEGSWASLGAYDIVTNGTEIRKTLNGTAFTAVSNIPASTKYIVSYHNFLFAFGHDVGKVRWSAIGDPETWPARNEWDLDSRGMTGTGMTVFKDMVMCFFEDAFFSLRGFGEATIQIVNDYREDGCTSHRSLVPCEFGLFWWGRSGLYHSPDGFEVRNVSRYRIPKTLENRNKSKDGTVHGIYNPDEQRIEMWFFQSGSTTQDIKLYYYPIEDAFFIGKGDGVEMTASGVVRESGVNTIYLANATKVYTQAGNTDNGVPITSILETKRDTPLHARAVKRLTQVCLYAYRTNAGSVQLSAYYNDKQTASQIWDITIESPSGFVLGTSKLGIDKLGFGAIVDTFEIGVNQNYKKVKFRIQESIAATSRLQGISHEGVVINQ